MYRILALTLLISVSESGWVINPSSYSPSQCQQSNPRDAEKQFLLLSQSIIDMDKELQKVCVQFPNVTVREIFNESEYKYQVSLPEFEGNFDVRIKHRVMYVNGHDPRLHPNCDRTYVSITVLPESVNPHQATWHFSLGTLIVTIPYRRPITGEVDVACSKDIDDTMIHVRKGY